MPTWLEIAKGPIFGFTLVILVLGLARLVILSVWGMITAIRRAGDRRVPYAQVTKETLSWLFPINRLHRTRPVFSYASFALHLGIIFAGLFLSNHIAILQFHVDIAWPAIYRPILDGLTLIAIVGGTYLLLFRIYIRGPRSLSGAMDYILLLLILNIVVSGYLAGRPWNPVPYDSLMLFHTLNGVVLLLLIPFTKIAHLCLRHSTRFPGSPRRPRAGAFTGSDPSLDRKGARDRYWSDSPNGRHLLDHQASHANGNRQSRSRDRVARRGTSGR